MLWATTFPLKDQSHTRTHTSWMSLLLMNEQRPNSHLWPLTIMTPAVSVQYGVRWWYLAQVFEGTDIQYRHRKLYAFSKRHEYANYRTDLVWLIAHWYVSEKSAFAISASLRLCLQSKHELLLVMLDINEVGGGMLFSLRAIVIDSECVLFESDTIFGGVIKTFQSEERKKKMYKSNDHIWALTNRLI